MGAPRGVWAAPPTRPMIRAGIVIKNTAGKARRVEIIEFTSREIKERWSSSIIAALREVFPDFDFEEAFEE